MAPVAGAWFRRRLPLFCQRRQWNVSWPGPLRPAADEHPKTQEQTPRFPPTLRPRPVPPSPARRMAQGPPPWRVTREGGTPVRARSCTPPPRRVARTRRSCPCVRSSSGGRCADPSATVTGPGPRVRCASFLRMPACGEARFAVGTARDALPQRVTKQNSGTSTCHKSGVTAASPSPSSERLTALQSPSRDDERRRNACVVTSGERKDLGVGTWP